MKSRIHAAGGIMKSRIIVAVAEQGFSYKANWRHCEVKDNRYCSGAVFYTRLAGGIVKSRILDAVMRHFFSSTRLAEGFVKSRIICAVVFFFLTTG